MQQTTPCSTNTTASVSAPQNPTPGSLKGAVVFSTVGSLNDLGAAGATAVSETGGDLTGLAGDAARGAPLIAAPIAAGTLAHGYATGNQQQEFDGGFGLTTLIVGAFLPPVGLGMALGKVAGDAAGLEDTEHNDPNILEEAALAPPPAQCPAQK